MESRAGGQGSGMSEDGCGRLAPSQMLNQKFGYSRGGQLQSSSTLRKLSKLWHCHFRKTCLVHCHNKIACSGQSQVAEAMAVMRGSKWEVPCPVLPPRSPLAACSLAFHPRHRGNGWGVCVKIGSPCLILPPCPSPHLPLQPNFWFGIQGRTNLSLSPFDILLACPITLALDPAPHPSLLPNDSPLTHSTTHPALHLASTASYHRSEFLLLRCPVKKWRQ